MQAHVFRVPSELGQPHRRFLCSDLHFGSPYIDKSRMRADLDAAKAAGCRILINGDVFDAIGPRDRKRFVPSCLDPTLRGVDDLSTAIVELGVKTLSPYADLIDIIGIGNHEEAWIKHYSTDLVAMLISRLNAELEKQGSEHRIRHGGIQGFWRTVFEFSRPGKAKPSVSHDLVYLHGSGGDSPVTKGAIDFFRRWNQYDADAVTQGHRHNRTWGHDSKVYLSPKGHLRHRDLFYLQTASYLSNVVQTSDKEPLSYPYSESKHFAPKPMGGLMLTLTPERSVHNEGEGNFSLVRVRQAVHADT